MKRVGHMRQHELLVGNFVNVLYALSLSSQNQHAVIWSNKEALLRLNKQQPSLSADARVDDGYVNSAFRKVR